MLQLPPSHIAPHRTPWHSGHSVATLHEAPTTRYFSIDPRAVPEAQADFYEEAYLKKEGLTQPNYGCTGVQVRLGVQASIWGGGGVFLQLVGIFCEMVWLECGAYGV